MKYLTFEYAGRETYGALHNEKIYPAREIFGGGSPGTLAGFIERGMTIDAAAIKRSDATPLAMSDIKLKAPIPSPRREIICLGKNYLDHVNEIKSTAPKGGGVPSAPVYFGKSARSVIGGGEIIPTHENVSSMLDYEAELAVVIGKECVDINDEDAFEYIFGYTVLNDVTARDLQARHGQWYLGKSLAGFCPVGPVIADKNEIPFPDRLNIRSYVNGELRQDSNTGAMIFGIPFIISQLSRGFGLFPGDIIATGTPAGVGHGFDPPKNLRRGDVVECEIEKIGRLTNTVGGFR